MSRVDTEIDKRLLGDRHRRGGRAARARPASPTRGSPTSCSSRSSRPSAPRRCSAAGANEQRPLWASTGVKDPALPDTLYVTELVAPGIVNTMPEKTLEATVRPRRHRRRHHHRRLRGRARRTSTSSPRVGVDFDDVTADARRRRRREVHRVVARAARHRRDGTARRAGSERDDLRHPRGAATSRPSSTTPCPAWSPTSSPRASPRGDATLWGPDAEAEASKRLGWVEAVAISRAAGRRDRGAARRPRARAA